MTERVTMVFEFDIKSFVGNPFKADTPFGKPETIGLGDAFAELDELQNPDQTSDEA